MLSKNVTYLLSQSVSDAVKYENSAIFQISIVICIIFIDYNITHLYR